MCDDEIFVSELITFGLKLFDFDFDYIFFIAYRSVGQVAQIIGLSVNIFFTGFVQILAPCFSLSLTHMCCLIPRCIFIQYWFRLLFTICLFLELFCLILILGLINFYFFTLLLPWTTFLTFTSLRRAWWVRENFIILTFRFRTWGYHFALIE